MFGNVIYEEAEENCEGSMIPNHANTSEEFWNTLEKREHYKLDEFLKKIDIWNKSTNVWEEIYFNKGLNRVLFR